MLGKNFTNREKYIALAMIAVVVGALIYLFIIEPITKRWSELDREIASKTQMLERDARLLSLPKATRDEYAKFSKYAKSAKREEEEMSLVLNEIEAVSKSSSCRIVNINPQGIKYFGNHKEALVDVTTESDTNQLSKFMYNIETAKGMILRVKRFTINCKSTQDNILRATLLIGKILID